MAKPFATDYIDVATRIVEFRTQHPEGSLQPADLAHPYRIEEVGGLTFIVYVAAAYRTADDARPGIGAAWEPFPGPTPYTRNSELQNAETSAWGRAIVAALAADTKKGVASADEVRNRQADTPPSDGIPVATPRHVTEIGTLLGSLPEARADAVKAWIKEAHPAARSAAELSESEAQGVIGRLKLERSQVEREAAHPESDVEGETANDAA